MINKSGMVKGEQNVGVGVFAVCIDSVFIDSNNLINKFFHKF